MPLLQAGNATNSSYCPREHFPKAAEELGFGGSRYYINRTNREGRG